MANLFPDQTFVFFGVEKDEVVHARMKDKARQLKRAGYDLRPCSKPETVSDPAVARSPPARVGGRPAGVEAPACVPGRERRGPAGQRIGRGTLPGGGVLRPVGRLGRAAASFFGAFTPACNETTIPRNRMR